MQIDAFTLPEDLIWVDEFNFDAVAQTLTRTESGALLVEETALVAGRPITLQGGADAAWIKRSGLITLRAMADATLETYTLTLNDSRTFTVMFRRPALQAEPVLPYSTPASGDDYSLTINLITV